MKGRYLKFVKGILIPILSISMALQPVTTVAALADVKADEVSDEVEAKGENALDCKAEANVSTGEHKVGNFSYTIAASVLEGATGTGFKFAANSAKVDYTASVDGEATVEMVGKGGGTNATLIKFGDTDLGEFNDKVEFTFTKKINVVAGKTYSFTRNNGSGGKASSFYVYSIKVTEPEGKPADYNITVADVTGGKVALKNNGHASLSYNATAKAVSAYNGDEIEVVATPDEGKAVDTVKFAGAAVEANAEGKYIFSATKAGEVAVTFKTADVTEYDLAWDLKTADATVKKNINVFLNNTKSGVSSNDTVKAKVGDTITATISANKGYLIDSVSYNGAEVKPVAKTNDYKVVYVKDADFVVDARVAKNIKLTYSKEGEGEVTGPATAIEGEEITVTILPGTDYTYDYKAVEGLTLKSKVSENKVVVGDKDIAVKVTFVPTLAKTTQVAPISTAVLVTPSDIFAGIQALYPTAAATTSVQLEPSKAVMFGDSIAYLPLDPIKTKTDKFGKADLANVTHLATDDEVSSKLYDELMDMNADIGPIINSQGQIKPDKTNSYKFAVTGKGTVDIWWAYASSAANGVGFVLMDESGEIVSKGPVITAEAFAVDTDANFKKNIMVNSVAIPAAGTYYLGTYSEDGNGGSHKVVQLGVRVGNASYSGKPVPGPSGDDDDDEPATEEQLKAISENAAARNDAASKDAAVVAVPQTLTDTIAVSENYVKGKVKGLTIAVNSSLSSNEVVEKEVTLNVGAKFQLAGYKAGTITVSQGSVSSNTTTVDAKAVAAAVKAVNVKKGVIAPKALKVGKTVLNDYKFNVSFQNEVGTEFVLTVKVLNPSVKLGYCANKANMAIYSVSVNGKGQEIKVSENAAYVRTVSENDGIAEYRYYVPNAKAFVSGTWTIGKDKIKPGQTIKVGKAGAEYATVKLAEDNKSILVTPIKGQKGAVKATVVINNKKYTLAIKVLNK